MLQIFDRLIVTLCLVYHNYDVMVTLTLKIVILREPTKYLPKMKYNIENNYRITSLTNMFLLDLL